MLTNNIKKYIIFLIMIFSLLNLCSCKTHEVDVHIFSNIDECKSIKNLKSDDAKITIYDSPKKDNSLKKLEYEEWFGCKYNSENFSFELFAYEFASSEIAMEYFENDTGKDSDPNPTFTDSTGTFHYERIAVSENKAYTIYCKSKDKEKVIEFLNNLFSEEIVNYII